MNVLLAVLWKDLVCEWRSRERVTAMAVFALLTVVIFHFALPQGATPEARASAPGVLWIAYLFAAMLGLNRAFGAELENDALSGLALAPVDRGWVWAGKAAAGFVLLIVVQAIAALAFALAFDLTLTAVLLPFAGVVALGAVGLSAVGTLLAAISARTRYRDVMLPLLMLPLLVPVLVGAVQATAGLLEDGRAPAAALQLLAVMDAVYLIVSFLCFEYVLDE